MYDNAYQLVVFLGSPYQVPNTPKNIRTAGMKLEDMYTHPLKAPDVMIFLI